MIPPPLYPPSGYTRVKIVKTFNELVTTRFGDGINALCWQRTLSGDFDEVVSQLAASDDVASLDDVSLRRLPLSAAGEAHELLAGRKTAGKLILIP